MLFKIVLAVYVSVIWVYCLYKSLAGVDETKTDFTVVLEWNAYLIDLLWVLSYVEEWKKIRFYLIEK